MGLFQKEEALIVEGVAERAQGTNLWLHFECPECQLARSISCTCGRGGGGSFFCSCIPQDCAVCGTHWHDEVEQEQVLQIEQASAPTSRTVPVAT